MMGGILANNSSGMCCGVEQNAYHTLSSIRFVLPDGLELDTADPAAAGKLGRDATRLARGLVDLKQRIEANRELRERIRSKYRMKNTNGYSLNAFIDFDEPLDILAHLMIGSEGTLGFVAEAVLNTVPDYPFKYTGLLFFDDVPGACGTIAALRDSGARALELMDRASLRSIEEQPGVPPAIHELPAGAAALLVEYQCGTERGLDAARRACDALLPSLPLTSEPDFTVDPVRQATLWRVRKGLIPSVGAMRRRGTSFIIEDVVFPVERLARGVAELQLLFDDFGYDDAIVFGHAKDGNLHFVFAQAFQDPPDVKRYDRFMHSLSDLVAGRHGGALKAEHGTGRNMAPFVEAEWGAEAYEIHRAVKRLVDPDDLLNPGVLINDDPNVHVTHLKPLPEVECEVDPCIECGFCERLCPSRDLTLTPRQRIVVRREMARLEAEEPHSKRLRELHADYGYEAIDTCAADGLCATGCPVGIDTGKLVKRLRRQAHSELEHELARIAAARFAWVERGARLALRAARWLRNGSWSDLPRAAPGELPASLRDGATAVYFPSCVSRVCGPARIRSPERPEDAPLAEVVLEVARRAGESMWIPGDVAGHCCGMPFSSKGYARASADALNRTIESLWRWSGGDALPVVLDTSPCAFTLRQARPELTPANRDRFDALRILDGIEFAHDRLLPRLRPLRATGSVVLHPVCSALKMDLAGKLRRLAEACSERVEVPAAAGCCGFAGDRGFTLPALTAAATRAEAEEVALGDFHGFYSSSRTCEIGLARATGDTYRSFWYLLERATRRPSEA
jgi:D-lactate dehydrogenase